MESLPSTRQLQHFSMLARVLHFGQAAQALGITQPSLSASIRELENLLGGPVVDRAGREVRLTALGQEVAQRTGRILAELADLSLAARQVSAPLTGSLRLGVIPTISAFLLPRLLPELRQRYPRLRAYLVEDQTNNLLDALARGELDVLMLALPCACEGESIVLGRDPFLLAMPRRHPLAKLKAVSTADLKDQKLLTLRDGHCLRDQVLSACGLRVSGDEQHAATSLHTLVQMVDNGLGLTLVPQLAVKAGLLQGTGLVTRPVVMGQGYRDIALLWRKGAARGPELQLLAKELRRLF